MEVVGYLFRAFLELYLTKEGLKPASSVNFIPYFFNSSVDEKINSEEIINRKSALFKEMLEREGLFYLMEEPGSFLISKTKEGLDNLQSSSEDLKAFSIRYGLALGYPSDAVEIFSTLEDEKRMNGAKLDMHYIDAKEKGIKIPEWCAYLTHIPAKLDLIKNDVSESSKNQAIKYMNYIREHNPKLANLLESEFKKQIDYLEGYFVDEEGYTVVKIHVPKTL